MKALEDHHTYLLDSFEGKLDQVVSFIKKEKQLSDELVTVHDGTTNEEVLRMLIHRLKALGAKLPSRENSLAITKCEEALMWLEKRTADRLSRGVEGTGKP